MAICSNDHIATRPLQDRIHGDCVSHDLLSWHTLVEGIVSVGGFIASETPTVNNGTIRQLEVATATPDGDHATIPFESIGGATMDATDGPVPLGSEAEISGTDTGACLLSRFYRHEATSMNLPTGLTGSKVQGRRSKQIPPNSMDEDISDEYRSEPYAKPRPC